MTKNKGILALLAIFVAILSLVFSPSNYSTINSSALISDEIEPFCLDNTISFNDPLSLEITSVQPKKWKINFIRVTQNSGETISEDYKKMSIVKVVVSNQNGEKCEDRAKIRLNGDWRDHLAGEHSSSVQLELESSNIDGVTQFKLLRPYTRNGDNEILINWLNRKLGFLAPRTRYINVNWNGVKTTYIMQEVIRKEFIENSGYRESLLIEGDEAGIWNEVGRGELWRNRLYRVNNLNKFVKTDGLRNDAQLALSMVNSFAINGCRKVNGTETFHENLVAFDLLQAVTLSNHSLATHNRKYYFDFFSRNMYAIAYDSNANFDTEISIEEWYKNYLDWLLGVNNGYGITYLGHCSIEAIYELQNKISKIEESIESSELLKLGLNIFPYKITKIKTTLNERLKKLVDKFDETAQYQNKNSLENLKVLETNFELGFVNSDGRGEICTSAVSIDRCTGHDEANELDLLSGADVNTQRPLIFVKSDIVASHSSLPWLGGQLEVYGDAKLKINEEKRFLNIDFGDYGHIIIRNSKLENWKVVGISTKKQLQSKQQGFVTGCLNLYESKVYNSNIEINGARCEDAINIVRSSVNESKITIRNAASDGIDFDFSKSESLNLSVENTGNDCVDFSRGDYGITNLRGHNCGDKGVSVGENSFLKVEKVKIVGSVLGIAVKDSALAFIESADLNVDLCAATYRKKQEFGGSRLQIKNLKCPAKATWQQNKSRLKVLNVQS
jgi:hypothetical protein